MPPPSEAVRHALHRSVLLTMLGVAAVACGRGVTDATPQLPLTAVSRLELQVDRDSILVGDSLAVTARGLNREGDVLALSTIIWSTADSSIGAVRSDGVVRGRNVGTVTVAALSAGAVGSRTIRVVPRGVRVRMLAPDTSELVDDVQLTTEVETTAGVSLPEVAPRFAIGDTAVATVSPIGVGRASVAVRRPGATDLLAIIGRDTTRRRFVVRLTPLRTFSVQIASRVVAMGDSVPLVLTAIDSAGRTIPSAGSILGLDPIGTVVVRNGHLVALAAGRVVVRAQNGGSLASDTLTVQGPSEFTLDLVDGDGQNPLPLRVLLSMERVASKWKRVIRASPPGEFVRLQVGECRNRVPVGQFITGVRVLITLDTLPARAAGRGGPCVIRPNGLPLLGTVGLNLFNYNTLSDQKLDDLLQHEVGHVLGLGTIWGRGALAGLVDGDSASFDPIFVGPNALGAFSRLGRSTQFTGRRVPLEIGVLGHWRSNAFNGELMSPTLITTAQSTSSVTVAALRDLGWTVEPEAYDEYALPDAVITGIVAPRIQGQARLVSHSLEGDALVPTLMISAGGRKVRLDPNGRPVLR